jgi:D-alanyl-D-alanine carboxypeptidase
MSALLHQLAEEFSIPVSALLGRHRTAYAEARDLVLAEVGEQGREHWLTAQAAGAWRQMQRAAGSEGVPIFIVSAFRSVERQTQIVRRKLASGVPIEEVLAVSSLPGFSEHHTGRALDIGTPGCATLEYSFQDTAAFSWLQAHAAGFDFQLSYPADNPEGYIYEPWHWCHQRD